MKEHKTYKGSWYEFTPGWSGFHLLYDVAGYFTSHPMLVIYFIWGKFFITLPWKHYKKVEREKTLKETRAEKLKILKNPNYKPKKVYRKEQYDECEPPSYGIYYHMDQIGIRYGTKVKLYDMPWAFDWIRTSCLKKDNTWETETRKNRKEFWNEDKWKDILFNEQYPYIYVKNDGTIQKRIATIKVEEREWRLKYFKWFKFIRKVRRDIDINFDKEVGEREGSWKGGTLGCSYEMKKGETPYDTLKRMEKERKFT